jgi:hypothetical protein
MIPPEADLAQALDEGSGERAQVGASDLQASPLSEGNRRLWVMYIKGQRWAQVKRTGCAFALRCLGPRGEQRRGWPEGRMLNSSTTLMELHTTG